MTTGPTVYARLLEEAYKQARTAGPETMWGDSDILEFVAPNLRDQFKRRFESAIRSAYRNGLNDGYQGAAREFDQETEPAA